MGDLKKEEFGDGILGDLGVFERLRTSRDEKLGEMG